MPFSTGFLVAFGSLLFLSLPAYAHKLLIEARVDGDRVRFEAYFDDDTPAQDARLLVENAKQEIVAEGKTDERGVWNCPLPAPGKYLVRADLLGHQAKRDLLIGDRAEKQDEGAKPQRNVSHAKPWLKAFIGIGAITVLFSAGWLIRRWQRRLRLQEAADSP